MLQLLVLQLIQKFILQLSVGANQTETLNFPEDGILYAARGGKFIVDGVGVTGNTSALNITLLIDK
jgi:hypothetical protein